MCFDVKALYLQHQTIRFHGDDNMIFRTVWIHQPEQRSTKSVDFFRAQVRVHPILASLQVQVRGC